MPKIAVNENRNPRGQKDDVWAAAENFDVSCESKAIFAQRFLKLFLRRSVSAPYGTHSTGDVQASLRQSHKALRRIDDVCRRASWHHQRWVPAGRLRRRPEVHQR